VKVLRAIFLFAIITGFPFSALAADSSGDTLKINNPPVAIRQLAKLTASDGFALNEFGYSIAMSGDVIVVGSLSERVYVFVKPKSGWQDMTQTAELQASIPVDGFGTSVAISGNIILVGAPNSTNPGKVFAYVRPVTGWRNMTETAQLVASDGEPGDGFGFSVSISRNAAVVGASEATINGNAFQGAAYVFTPPENKWAELTGATLTETAKLTASDGIVAGFFGTGVSISGKVIAIGATLQNAGTGEGYVFVEPDGGWTSTTETAQLKPSDGGGDLGSQIATNGTTVVATAPDAGERQRKDVGTVYVFAERESGWTDMTETAQLLPSTTPGPIQGPVAIDATGHYVAAGSPAGYGNHDDSGQVYLFSEPAGGWQTTLKSQKIFSSDGQRLDEFGSSVAIGGQTLVAGAPFASIGVNLQQGAAYVFGKE